MPFFALDHIRLALDYFQKQDHTHPALMSLLAMLRQNVPASDNPDDAIPFGSTVERRLMDDYFKPSGGPEKKPYFLVFGTGYGYSHWRDREYPGRTLQVQRNKHDLFRQSPKDNKRWTLASSLAQAIKDSPPKEVIGDIPISTACLAAWCYRDREIASISAAVADFSKEFRLNDYGLVPEIFSTDIPVELAAVPLQDKAISSGDLLLFLQNLEPEKAEEEPAEEAAGPHAAPSAAIAKVHMPAPPPGDWNMALADLGDLCGLRGMEEAATRALAALAAGVHVILTGPPGSGKTKLAECICAKAGFPTWTVPATDQWTTFETIGGYFPTPKEGEAGDRLDFLPGAVVDSLEKGKCLIIDEINRADIDKAFGELFTLLSGNTVTLPYRRRSDDGKFRRVRLQVGSAVVEDEDADVIVVPAWWRIVGSMNDADKASLKRLSMAFVRRFAFIPIDLPEPAVYEALIRAAVDKTDASKTGISDMPGLTKVLIELFSTVDNGIGAIGLPLGPAFPLSIVRHADSEWRLDTSRSFEAVLASALELYVMPQFQGRPDLHEKASDLFRPLLPTRHDEFERHLAVWTGYVSG
ncbi:AAA family ATPase [Rhodopseudomonas palustris]|uniref:AAA family ATPase n=1 Tax=Rhodopseudomonas palustris TaxID=1076 RepID=UPI000641F292|nr:AAA family ATPase [Rhodopseudomonas palustris]